MIVLIFTTILTDFVFATDNWSKASSGQSSFKNLGSEFFVEVNLEPIKGGRLVLFNDRLAKILGLAAADKKELINKLKSHFLLTVSDKATPASRTGFATYYCDVAPDHPEFHLKSGDGRVVWIGEITSLPNNENISPLDVTLKGVGRTPIAIDIINGPDGKPHPQALQYGDGLQTMSEAVRSFIASEAMVGNEIRTTVDLAVFELPFLKRNPVTGKKEKAALTVRIGPQVRIAHLEYHKKGSPEHKKLLDYVIRRTLRLSSNQELGDKEALDYLYATALRFAQVAAKYRDAHFFHGSLTSSNISTDGFAFDFGTLMAMDVFQPEIKSDAAHKAKAKDQWRNIFGRVGQLVGHVQAAGYLKEPLDSRISDSFSTKGSLLKTEIANFFVSHMDGQFTIATLKRLGLTGYQLDDLIKRGVLPSVAGFMDQVEQLQEYLSPHLGNYMGRQIYPTAFDIRKILRSSLAIALLPQEKQEAEWRKVFLIKRSWSTFKDKDLRLSHMRNYINELAILASNLQDYGVDLRAAADRALEIGAEPRKEGFFPDDSQLIRFIQTGNNSYLNRIFNKGATYEEYTSMALNLSDSLIAHPSSRNSPCEEALGK